MGTRTKRNHLGKLEYEKGCIGCHGVDAKGSGVHTPRLKNDPPDLTVLAKANGGIFPIQKIYEEVEVPSRGW
jgi:mono/diheme cytochrome c family protein